MENEVKTQETPVNVENKALEGLHPEEVKMYEKHYGKPKEEKEKVEEPKKEEVKEDVKKENPLTAAFNEIKEKTVEQIEQEKYEKYNPNEKAMYHLQKKERAKRQAAEKERDLMLAQLNETNERLKIYEEKLKAIEEQQQVIGDDDVLTGADYKRLAAQEVEKKQLENSKNHTEEQIKEHKAQILKTKLEALEIEAREKYADLDNAIVLAKEVLETQSNSAKVRRLYKDFMEAVTNPDLDADESAFDLTVQIAELNPKYKKGEPVIPEKETEIKLDKSRIDIDRIIKNANKKIPSSTVKSGTNEIPETELTVQQALKLPNDQYRKLKPEIRRRLLMEST